MILLITLAIGSISIMDNCLDGFGNHAKHVRIATDRLNGIDLLQENMLFHPAKSGAETIGVVWRHSASTDDELVNHAIFVERDEQTD